MIGAVLIPGAKAPHLVRREDLKRMPPRAVVIDVAIDQGGCFETSRPTTHAKPDVHRGRHRPLLRDEHAGGGGPDEHLRADQRDAALRPAAGEQGAWSGRCRENPALAAGVNVRAGKVTNEAVAETFGLECAAVV